MKPEELFDEVNKMWDDVHNKLGELKPLVCYKKEFNQSYELRGISRPLTFLVQKVGGKWTICVDTSLGVKPVRDLGFDLRCQLLEFAPQVVNEVVGVNKVFFDNMQKEIAQARQFHKQFLTSCQLMDKTDEI